MAAITITKAEWTDSVYWHMAYFRCIYDIDVYVESLQAPFNNNDCYACTADIA